MTKSLKDFDFDTVAFHKYQQANGSRAPKNKAQSLVKQGLAFLNVYPELRDPADVAREIWQKLSTPCYMSKWQQDIKYYGFAVAAACHYENRAMREPFKK
jgi:hypothetical protein